MKNKQKYLYPQEYMKRFAGFISEVNSLKKKEGVERSSVNAELIIQVENKKNYPKESIEEIARPKLIQINQTKKTAEVREIMTPDKKKVLIEKETADDFLPQLDSEEIEPAKTSQIGKVKKVRTKNKKRVLIEEEATRSITLTVTVPVYEKFNAIAASINKTPEEILLMHVAEYVEDQPSQLD